MSETTYRDWLATRLQKNLNRELRNAVLVGLMVLAAGGSMLMALLWTQREAAESQQRAETRIEQLNQEIDRLKAELDHRKVVDSMAIEFGLSPLVVEAFYDEAGKTVDVEGDWKTWRFVRTAEYLTYLMCSIVSVESAGDMYAVGDSGKAIGLTQIWLTTAQDYDPDVTREALMTLPVQAHLATLHFARLLQQFDGNHARAIISWNRGQGRVDRLLSAGISPENGYLHRVYTSALEWTSSGGAR